MGKASPLPMPVAAALVAIARSSEFEQCGFILDGWGIRPMVNWAYEPRRNFKFMYTEQHDVVDSGANIIGIYHTHPGGTSRPSQNDIEGWPMVNGEGCRYWIATSEALSEWAKDKDGKVTFVGGTIPVFN